MYRKFDFVIQVYAVIALRNARILSANSRERRGAGHARPEA